MTTKNRVAKWLKSIHRTQSVRPCVVSIGTDTYEGAMYECVGEFVANQDAIVRGERKVGDIYIQRTIYLVGNVPPVVKERRRTCFTFEGQDWFLAAHSAPGPDAFIIIDPWTCPGKIDDGDRPYRRVPMAVKLGRCL